MKFTVETSTLSKMLECIYPAVVKGKNKNTLVAYKSIRIKTTENGKVSMSADDGSHYVETANDAKIETVGSVGVNGKVFAQFIKTLPNTDVTMESKGATLRISCDRRIANINTVDLDAIPERWLPEYNALSYYETDGLIEALKRVAFATTDDETRFVLQTIYVHQNHVVATDGHRLALIELPMAVSGEFKIHYDLVDRFKKSLDGKMLLTRYDNRMLIINGDTKYIIPEPAHQYPNYQGVIPVKTTRSLTLKTEPVRQTLKNIKAMQDGNVKVFKVILEVNDNGCTMSFSDSSVGTIINDLDCVAKTDNIRIGFNVQYLLDALNTIEGENFTLEFQNATSPVKIIEKNLTQVVMPLRI